MRNAFIGAGLGLATGGAVLMFGGLAGALIVGSATVAIPIIGLTGLQTVACGALAYNVLPMIIAPFFGIEVDTAEIST